MSAETVAVKTFDDGSMEPMTFGELLSVNNVSVLELSDWTMISRQMIYRYINGQVNPEKISYINVTQIATYLDEKPIVVYNSLVQSYEGIRIWCETLKKWLLPEEITEKVR